MERRFGVLIFTVKNKMTGDIFVGTTGNDLVTQWQKILDAADLDLDYPLYRQIRRYGEDQFLVEEWDWTDNRRELSQLERDAIATLGAQSLRGYKTAVNKPRTRRASRTPSNAKMMAMEKELAQMIFGDDETDDEPGLFDEIEIPTPKGRLIKAEELEQEQEQDPADEAPASTLRVSAPAPSPRKVVAQAAAPVHAEAAATPAPKPVAPAQTEAPAARPLEPSVAAHQTSIETRKVIIETELEPVHTEADAAPAADLEMPAPRPWQKPKLDLDDEDIDSFLADMMNLMEPTAATDAPQPAPAAAVTAEIEAPAPAALSPEEQRQQRILIAVQSQRSALAARTQADLDQERDALAARLAEFNRRAAELQAVSQGCLH